MAPCVSDANPYLYKPTFRKKSVKRVPQFILSPRSYTEGEVFVRWLDASASLRNETTDGRRPALLSDDTSVRDADTGNLEAEVKGGLTSSVAQQIIRRNSQA